MPNNGSRSMKVEQRLEISRKRSFCKINNIVMWRERERKSGINMMPSDNNIARFLPFREEIFFTWHFFLPGSLCTIQIAFLNHKDCFFFSGSITHLIWVPFSCALLSFFLYFSIRRDISLCYLRKGIEEGWNIIYFRKLENLKMKILV